MRIFVSFVALFLTISLFAQPRKDKNKKFVIEAGFGINSVLKSKSSPGLKYRPINPINAHGNINYAFTEKFGISALGNYHSIGSTYTNGTRNANYFVGSVLFTLDLGHVFKLYDTRTKDNILFLVGPGLGFNIGNYKDKLTRWERIYNLTYGFSYEHQLTDDLSLSADIYMKSGASQQLAYDIHSNTNKNGNLLYISCGVAYLLDF